MRGMNTLINIWTLYQSEINVQFSRFASFIEVGGRTGLGYRDTAQDAMTVLHSEPARCKERIVQLFKRACQRGIRPASVRAGMVRGDAPAEFQEPDRCAHAG